MDYERGPEKIWFYGAMRIHDGKVLTHCAALLNSKSYIASLTDSEADNPRLSAEEYHAILQRRFLMWNEVTRVKQAA